MSRFSANSFVPSTDSSKLEMVFKQYIHGACAGLRLECLILVLSFVRLYERSLGRNDL